MNLKESFIKYKDITLAIEEIMRVEEYEKLDRYFRERQLILNNIGKMNYSKDELKKFYYQYEIDKLEKKLNLEMRAKKEDLLKKIKENQKRKIAMNGYNNLGAKAVFLSKEF